MVGKVYSRRSSGTVARNLVLDRRPLRRLGAVVVAGDEVLVVLAEADPVVGYAFVDFGHDARAAGVYDAGVGVSCCPWTSKRFGGLEEKYEPSKEI